MIEMIFLQAPMDGPARCHQLERASTRDVNAPWGSGKLTHPCGAATNGRHLTGGAWKCLMSIKGLEAADKKTSSQCKWSARCIFKVKCTRQ